MEPVQTLHVATAADLVYRPREDEKEKASNGYLMSVIAIMMGLPLPVINLLATFIFFLANRKSTWFVRWHCTQALLSQFTVFIVNSVAFGWTISVLLEKQDVTDGYIGYLIVTALFNLLELIITISGAIRVRKGQHVIWWFWGDLTDVLVGKKQTI
ncbi:MAG: DUF4870 domain-containing protein [Sphingobacteriales bacterium]|nr:MAG: DUF4870 domain-containing protein [Sphingobacteriales bacterium]